MARFAGDDAQRAEFGADGGLVRGRMSRMASRRLPAEEISAPPLIVMAASQGRDGMFKGVKARC